MVSLANSMSFTCKLQHGCVTRLSREVWPTRNTAVQPTLLHDSIEPQNLNLKLLFNSYRRYIPSFASKLCHHFAHGPFHWAGID